MRNDRFDYPVLGLALVLGCQSPSGAPGPVPPGSAPATTTVASAHASGAVSAADAGACGTIPPDVQALVDALDKDPDELHVDYTPAVFALSERGLAGACAVIEQLDTPNPLTRLHAQRVLEGVVMRRHGWRAGRGYPDGYGEERTRAVVASLGYASHAAPEARRAAMARARTWLAAVPMEPPPYAPADGPSREQMMAALEPAREALERCVEAMGPVDVVVVFASSGRVRSIWSQYTVPPPARECLKRAVAQVSVPPFQRADASVVYTPASK